VNTPRYWKPLREHPNEAFKMPSKELIAIVMEQYKLDEAAARQFLDDDHTRYRFFINDIYQVQVARTGDNGDFLHLNIRRLDGGMVRDWRHFQQIKNEIAGEEREAIEIFPAESRKVDTSNKWHLWVLPEGAVVNLGWGERDVQYNELRGVPGLRQRPL
jgi:hypothetical protein